MNVTKLSYKSLGVTLMLATSCIAQAANYPDRPITMIIPYNAGGGTDVLARALQPALEKSLGQTIVVSKCLVVVAF